MLGNWLCQVALPLFIVRNYLILKIIGLVQPSGTTSLRLCQSADRRDLKEELYHNPGVWPTSRLGLAGETTDLGGSDSASLFRKKALKPEGDGTGSVA
jgi:hypothetical protein